MKKLLSPLALVFAFGAKISAQSDDIDNSTATYAYVKDVKIWLSKRQTIKESEYPNLGIRQ